MAERTMTNLVKCFFMGGKFDGEVKEIAIEACSSREIAYRVPGGWEEYGIHERAATPDEEVKWLAIYAGRCLHKGAWED